MSLLHARSSSSLPSGVFVFVRASLPVVALGLLVACGGAPEPVAEEDAATAEAALEPITLEPCAEHPDLRCARVEVWEDREARAGRRIELNVVVVPAAAEKPEPDPIFFFAGGPGDGAAGHAPLLAQFMAPLVQDRDLVLVDQRGTGESHRLDCDVPGSRDQPLGYFDDFLGADMARACRRQLEQKADLTLYTTPIAMDDVDEVRRRLGYDRINVMGGSYGTRAAQVYMRRHRDSVRTATLLGVAGMKQYLPLYHARDAQAAMDRLLDACAADESCAAAFPDVRAELDAVIARLDEAPATATVPHPVTGEPLEVPIERDVFAENLRFSTYAPALGVAAPLLVHRAFEGDFTPFARMTLLTEPELREILAFGMHLSVICAEDVPFYPDNWRRLVDGTYLGDYRVRLARESCAEWPRADIPAGYHDFVTVDVPTLLVSGGLDPVTPPVWAAEAAEHLPDSLHVVVGHGHHDFGGLANLDCFLGLLADFLDRGSVEGLDTACVDTMTRPPFLTDVAQLDGLLTRMEGMLAAPEEAAPEAAAEEPAAG